jgi:hypothetical protein
LEINRRHENKTSSKTQGKKGEIKETEKNRQREETVMMQAIRIIDEIKSTSKVSFPA